MVVERSDDREDWKFQFALSSFSLKKEVFTSVARCYQAPDRAAASFLQQ
jgi:hypothetical protein